MGDVTCKDCEYLLDADEDEYRVTRYRCAVHLAELEQRLEEQCQEESPWELERHKRGMAHDLQMARLLDRMIAQKRRAMGLGPRHSRIGLESTHDQRTG